MVQRKTDEGGPKKGPGAVDMREMMELATMNIAELGKQMRATRGDFDRLEKEVHAIRTEFRAEIDSVKGDMRITRSMARNIRRAVVDRVNVLLKLKMDGGKVSDKDIPYEMRYRPGFIARCYTDAKKANVLAECYADTPRSDFNKALEYIEAWKPEVSGGVEEYKRYLDARRDERLKEAAAIESKAIEG